MRACALVFFSLGVLVRDNTSKPDALGALANIVISKENDKTSISSYNLPTVNHQGELDKNSVYKLTEYDEDLVKENHKKFSFDKVKKLVEILWEILLIVVKKYFNLLKIIYSIKY
jgi:hypothetical protein